MASRHQGRWAIGERRVVSGQGVIDDDTQDRRLRSHGGEDRRAGNAGPGGDVLDRGRQVALVGEQPVCGGADQQGRDSQSYDNEIIAARASNDLAYTVAYEHTTASIHGGRPTAYVLHVTTVFHREDGDWKVVHRHADPSGSPTAGELLQQLATDRDTSSR